MMNQGLRYLLVFLFIVSQTSYAKRQTLMKRIHFQLQQGKIPVAELVEAMADGSLSHEEVLELRGKNLDVINYTYQAYQKHGFENEGVWSITILEYLIQHRDLYPDLLRQILDDPHTNVNYVNKMFKTTPLMLAISVEAYAVFDKLLERGAKLFFWDVEKKTALHYAAQGGHPYFVAKLLKLGADARCWDYEDKTPLATAIFQKSNLVIPHLLQFVDPFEKKVSRRGKTLNVPTAFEQAVAWDADEFFVMMLDKDPKRVLSEIENFFPYILQSKTHRILRIIKDRLVPLMPAELFPKLSGVFSQAVKEDLIDKVKILHSIYPLWLKSLYFEEGRSLTVLMQTYNAVMLRTLMDLGADPRQKGDSYEFFTGMDAVGFARENGYPSYLQLMLQTQASLLNSLEGQAAKHDEKAEVEEEDTEEDRSNQCVWCREESKDSDREFVTLPCGHTVGHRACLAQWRGTCPNCRAYWGTFTSTGAED